jgi:hypothetical protein
VTYNTGWKNRLERHDGIQDRRTRICGISSNNEKDQADNHGISLLEGDHRLVNQREPPVRECGNDLKQRKPGEDDRLWFLELLRGTHHTGEMLEWRFGGAKSCSHCGRDMYGAKTINHTAWMIK